MSYFDPSGEISTIHSSGVPGLPKVFCKDGKVQVNQLDRIFSSAIENHKKNAVFFKGKIEPYTVTPFDNLQTGQDDGFYNKLEIAHQFEVYMKENVKTKKEKLKKELEQKNLISYDEPFQFNLNKNDSESTGNLIPESIKKKKSKRINKNIQINSTQNTKHKECSVKESKTNDEMHPTHEDLHRLPYTHDHFYEPTSESNNGSFLFTNHETHVPLTNKLIEIETNDDKQTQEKNTITVVEGANSGSIREDKLLFKVFQSNDSTENRARQETLDAINQNTPTKVIVKKDFQDFSSDKPILSVMPPPHHINNRQEAYVNTRHFHIKENQRGVSFDYLFAQYTRGASLITVTDPYVRFFYQIRNLMEFLETVLKNRIEGQEVSVHLITIEDSTKGEKQRESLEKIKESCKTEGLYFSYEFDET